MAGIRSNVVCFCCSYSNYEGRFFYVRRMVYLMKTARVNAYTMYIFGKIELLSIHAT